MPDRVIRDELLESERWLSLPSDTDRLAFIGLLLRCDDFGNLEGGSRRLYRFLHTISQVKSEEATAAVLLHLTDSDMIRQYAIDGRDFYHLPRFRPHRQYLVRKYPPSPWDAERELGKNQRVTVRGLAKDQALSEKVVTTSHPSSNHVALGVGVGDGVGDGVSPNMVLGARIFEPPAAARPIQSQKLAPPPSGLPAAPRLGATNVAKRTRKPAEPAKSSFAWESYSVAYRSRYGIDPVRNSKGNALLCHLVDRLGVDDAPPVAAFYVRHNAEWYVKHGHALEYLIRDCEKLRTEWATGIGVTSSQARQIDRTQGQANVWGKLIAEAQAEERQNGEK